MISSPITYRPSHQPSISESENTSTSLRSPPPRPGKDAPPRPDKECDLYDDVSERTHLQKVSESTLLTMLFPLILF